jgi:hypothetical protein
MPRSEERPLDPDDGIQRFEVSKGPEPTAEVLRAANSARMYYSAAEAEATSSSSAVTVLKLRRGP